MKLRAEIFSYWTCETDLAHAFSTWVEFVSGSGYSVDLKSMDTGEDVKIRMENGGDDRRIAVSATVPGPLFERALGRATLEMAKNSEVHVIAVDTDA